MAITPPPWIILINVSSLPTRRQLDVELLSIFVPIQGTLVSTMTTHGDGRLYLRVLARFPLSVSRIDTVTRDHCILVSRRSEAPLISGLKLVFGFYRGQLQHLDQLKHLMPTVLYLGQSFGQSVSTVRYFCILLERISRETSFMNSIKVFPFTPFFFSFLFFLFFWGGEKAAICKNQC